MSMTRHDDVIAVRDLADELAAGRGEPSLARSWHKLTTRRQPPRRRRLLVPAAAGLAVLIAATTVWILGSARSQDGQRTASRPVPIAQAWAELIAAARNAEPAVLSDGSVIYVRVEGASVALSQDPGPWIMQDKAQESWLDPQGMRELLARAADGKTIAPHLPGSEPAPVTLDAPTPQWIASLPTEPETLRDLLLAQSAHLRGDWSSRHGLWSALGELFQRADLVIPPAVRIAIYQVLAQESGLTASRTTVAGRDVYVISRIEGVDGYQLLFDPDTGRVVGRRILAVDDVGNGGAPADRVAAWFVWDQAVVTSLGETPR